MRCESGAAAWLMLTLWRRLQPYLEPSFCEAMVAAGVITEDNSTWPVDCYVYPPPTPVGKNAADGADDLAGGADQFWESDEGSALVDSDIGYQSNYDSDNEDETAWARSFVEEGPEAATQAGEADEGAASASDASTVPYGYGRRCVDVMMRTRDSCCRSKKQRRSGVGAVGLRAVTRGCWLLRCVHVLSLLTER